MKLPDLELRPLPEDDQIIALKNAGVSDMLVANQLPARITWTAQDVKDRWLDLCEWSDEDTEILISMKEQNIKFEDINPLLRIRRTVAEAKLRYTEFWHAIDDEVLLYFLGSERPTRIEVPRASAHINPVYLAAIEQVNQSIDICEGLAFYAAKMSIASDRINEIVVGKFLLSRTRSAEEVSSRLRILQGVHWNSEELEVLWREGCRLNDPQTQMSRIIPLLPRRYVLADTRSVSSAKYRYARLLQKAEKWKRAINLRRREKRLPRLSQVDLEDAIDQSMHKYLAYMDEKNGNHRFDRKGRRMAEVTLHGSRFAVDMHLLREKVQDIMDRESCTQAEAVSKLICQASAAIDSVPLPQTQ